MRITTHYGRSQRRPADRWVSARSSQNTTIFAMPVGASGDEVTNDNALLPFPSPRDLHLHEMNIGSLADVVQEF